LDIKKERTLYHPWKKEEGLNERGKDTVLGVLERGRYWGWR